MNFKGYFSFIIVLSVVIAAGCAGFIKDNQKKSELKAGMKLSSLNPDWKEKDRCTKCHMAWSWEYGYYRGWDRHGLISDYSKVSPAGYKDPYGLDVPVNSFAQYYYTNWGNDSRKNSPVLREPEMRLGGYGRINDGTALPSDFKGTVIVVDSTGSGNALTVQEGIDKAKPGDTVFVMPGTYKEIIKLRPGIRLWGKDAYTTILDSENKGSTIIAANNCDISGFTITGTGFDYSNDRFHAAVHSIDCDSTLVIRGNLFFSNSVFGILVETSRADGYYTSSADRYIAPENAFDNIEYKGWSNPRIVGNTFYNIGERAIYCIHSAPEIANNIFMGNLKTLGMTQLSRPFIHHNVFYRNTVSININRSTPIICRNIMLDNYWGQRVMEGSSPFIRDNVTWNSPYYNEFAEDGRHIIYKPVPGNGEKEIDPKFMDKDGGDFRFAAGSPFNGKNTKSDHYGIIEGPGIQVPPTIACEYSWAEEFLHRTPETKAIIAVIDSVNDKLKKIELSYTVQYRSFMSAQYDSSGNQIDFDLKAEPVSGTDYTAKESLWDNGKRSKSYTSNDFYGEKARPDSGTVLFDGRNVHVLSGRFKPASAAGEDKHPQGELPSRENVGGLYLDYDQYLNGSIGPAGTFFYGYLRILGGEVAKEREVVDGHDCIVARYPHLGTDQVYKFYLDPEIGLRPRRLEQYFDKMLYRRVDSYVYTSADGVYIPVYARVTDYAVKKQSEGKIIGVSVMTVDIGSLNVNGKPVRVSEKMPGAFDFTGYAKSGVFVPAEKVKKHKKKTTE